MQIEVVYSRDKWNFTSQISMKTSTYVWAVIHLSYLNLQMLWDIFLPVVVCKLKNQGRLSLELALWIAELQCVKSRFKKINIFSNIALSTYHLFILVGLKRPVRMAIIKKTTNKNVGEDVEKEEPLTLVHYWWEGKLIQSLWKTVQRFS